MSVLVDVDPAISSRPAFRVGRFSTVWRPKLVFGNLALLAVLFGFVCLNIGRGDYPMGVDEVAGVLLGGGDAAQQFIVLELRMPRSLVGVLVGMALGLSGAIAQSITRNPLASPDLLGITAGASLGAVSVIIFGFTMGIPFAAMAGGLLTAVAIYLLAWRRGTVGFRLVLVGIAIQTMLVAATNWLMIIGNIWDVSRATVWLNGSLNARDWDHVWPVAIALVVIGAVLMVSAFQLSALKLGADTAAAIGSRVHLTQVVLLVLAVLLAAISVTAAGPIGFVAFMAPQMAARVLGTAGPTLMASGLMGAALVVASDLAARTILPVELPVGVVTTAVGGPFLMYLIVQANRKRTV